ncbi:MAG: 5-(carboxyamino)imidazole ribonucleotide synthase [Thermoflavifilum sp.]|nr:5-(carboxyamino)imidazole ribonucleotide synthase [Thermoflavifilum sp.]
MDLIPSQYRLGITAGGQLGKMLAQVATAWSLPVVVMDPDPHCPASSLAQVFIQGNQRLKEDLHRLSGQIQFLALEIEHVDIEGLQDLQRQGIHILPDPASLAIIQDKGLQKMQMLSHRVPTMPFQLVDGPEEIIQKLKRGEISLPFIQKTRKAGYDGRGVKRVDKQSDLADLLEGPSVVETICDIDKELSVIVAGGVDGTIAIYPPVEMVFHPEAHLVEYLLCPARIDEEQRQLVNQVAQQTYWAFRPGGLLAVEMFLDKQGNCWVNEVAPRPHNSGHHTIEACITSQYEQQLRCLLGLPLGDTTLIKPSAMVNLLGEPGYVGVPRYTGFAEVLKWPEIYVHIYGKPETRPFRKMGHVTILGNDVAELEKKVQFVKQTLKVIV